MVAQIDEQQMAVIALPVDQPDRRTVSPTLLERSWAQLWVR